MGNKPPIGVSEGGRVCAGGIFSVGGFCIQSFTFSEMVDKLINGAEKFTTYGIDGAIEKD